MNVTRKMCLYELNGCSRHNNVFPSSQIRAAIKSSSSRNPHEREEKSSWNKTSHWRKGERDAKGERKEEENGK